MKLRRLFPIILVVLLLMPVVGWAADWYVRPAGGNYGNEDGTSYENAWDGFANIDWSKIQPGDALNLTGVFEGESLDIQTHDIVIQGYDYAYIYNNNENVIINSTHGAHDIILRDIEIGEATNYGIRISFADNIHLLSLHVHDSGKHGILVVRHVDPQEYADNLTIENCVIENCGDDGSGGRCLHGTVGENAVIKNCILRGADSNGSSLCPGGENSSIKFDNCTFCYNGGNGLGIAANLNSGSSVTITHSTIMNNSADGVLVHSTQSGSLNISYCLIAKNAAGVAREPSCPTQLGIYNCCIVDNLNYGLYINSSADIHLRNSCLYMNGVGVGTVKYEIVWGDTDQSIDSDFNCIVDDAYVATIKILADNSEYSLDQWKSFGNQDAHSFSDNPHILPNYHLAPDSPCIDAGVKLPIHDSNWRDLAGNRIRYGTAPDIGCYEYKTWPLGAWGMLPWIGGRHKVQWTPYE